MKITINPLPYKYEMKKILSIVLTLAMLLSLSAAAFAEETKAPVISAKDMSFYLNDLDDVKTYPVYFMGDSDVPYFSLADWAELMTYLMHTYIKKDQNISFELSFSMEGNTGVLTREDGYPAYFDCDADSVYFWDYDAFQRPDEDRVLIDILGVGNPGSEEEVMYFQRCPGSYERYGKDVTLNLASYGIDMVADGGNCYVPIQTLSDFLLAIQYMNVFYNGEAFYVVPFGGMGQVFGAYSPIGEQFHAVELKDRSAAMGEFSYAELCAFIEECCAEEGAECEIFQSNHEGAIVDRIQRSYGAADAIVINPAAYTHTSVAILDALRAVTLPAVEVHLSRISERESFRQISYTSLACEKTIEGKGFEGYREAIRFLTREKKQD